MTNAFMNKNPNTPKLSAILAGLFMLTACGGSVLTIDAPTLEGATPSALLTQNNGNAWRVNTPSGTLQSSAAPIVPTSDSQQQESIPESQILASEAESREGGATGSSHPTDTAITFDDWKDSNTVTKAAVRDGVDNGGTPDNRADDINNQRNQFLLGGATELDRAGAVRTAPLRMNLAQATHDGAAIGRDAVDGIDFFTASHQVVTRDGDNQITGITKSRYHYAGILSGTDLGAPVATAGVEATWNGSFRTYNTNAVDFQLTVTFGESGGTISAFVKDNARASATNYYLLAGTYTTAGVITGTVNWGQFTGGERATPVGGNNGTLTGLIGMQGAVGVFISDTNDEGTSGGYAGGFVASPTLPDERATYRDWTASSDNPSARAGTIEDDDSGDDVLFNQFLATRDGATQLDETGLDNITERGGLTLASDADSGVAFISDGITRATLTSGVSYAGLLAGTDLGAPITDAAQVGEWKGRFKSVGGYYYGDATTEQQRIATAVDTDFTLTVTFGDVSGKAGSIEAFVATSGINRRFLLTGTYDANGVITGTVLAGLFNSDDKSNPSATINGVLTGLIGIDGAVGAFHSNADNYNYAGGFVAAPVVAPPFVPEADGNDQLVDYSDWARHQEGLSNTSDTVSPSNQFLGTDVGDTELAEAIPLRTLAKNGGNLVINEAIVGGFSVFSSGTQYYAGILAGTNLGAPVTETNKMVTWSGSFYSIGRYDIYVDAITDSDAPGRVARLENFNLDITFRGAGDGGSIAAFLPITNNGRYYRIDGTFDAGGYITGNVNFGGFNNNDRNDPLDGRPNNGVLTGLIGQTGAIGVFISNPVDLSVTTGEHNFRYAGGFAVAPAQEVDTAVNFADWEASFTGGVNAGAALRDSGYATPTGASAEYIKLDGSNDIVATVHLDSASQKVLRLNETMNEDGYESGVVYNYGLDFTAPSLLAQIYAGLLPTTDLGAPLTESTKQDGIWTGRLKGYAGNTAILEDTAFALSVTFTGAGGTIASVSTQTADVGLTEGSFGIYFNGNFDAKGVIWGTTAGSDGNAATGTFSGLIGAKGAVGVFRGIDSSNATDSYGGGFVAKPPVIAVGSTYATDPTTYSDWVDSFTGGVNESMISPLRPSGFANPSSGTSEYIKIKVGETTIPLAADLNNSISTRHVRLSGANESGVAYGLSAKGNAYAGLLPTTNVGGAILTQSPARAVWEGRLNAVNGQETLFSSRTLAVEIIFGAGDHAGTIKTLFNKEATTAGLTLLGDNVDRSRTTSFYLDGDFNAAGVMWGETAFDSGATPNGVFSGLIGQKGAVGAFKGVGVGNIYAGGFQAKPQ